MSRLSILLESDCDTGRSHTQAQTFRGREDIDNDTLRGFHGDCGTAADRCTCTGIDHDTAQFAVQSIGSWWRQMGQPTYPHTTELLIIADAGGSNGYRTRLWKRELQRLADETKLTISVCHLPPGTSKWNKIEHRMFCHITQNWRGRPLISLDTIVNLIANTRTSKGLTIHSALDQNFYEKGIKVSDEEMAQLRIKREAFHGEWNYSIHP
jgi:hypothetical protein